MSSIAIVTDSTCALPLEELEKYNITVVPLQVIFGDETYQDGIDLTEREFFKKLEHADSLPTTSQPSLGVFVETYERLSKQYDRALSIHISSGISGTYQTAQTAASMVEGFPIDVVDSEFAAYPLGFMVLEAAQMAREGTDEDAILKRINQIRRNIKVYFVVDDLNHLYRGGRLSAAQLVVGNMLKIKPILTMKKTILPYQKVRTRKKAKHMIMNLFSEDASLGKPLKASVIHADISSDALEWREEIEKRFPHVVVNLSSIGPVIAAHTGPGTFGLCWYENMI